ncbi:MAG: hypothetical protein IV107_20590 [Paucibacter sp.]|nr:hypothetical protein [Roseateles sp.]
MKARFGPSLYFASDKVIFDAINHSQVNTDLIRELLFERGIISSPKTTKYELAQYFSRLTADYFDHLNIGNKLGKVAKRERITYAEISDTVTKQEILDGLSSVKATLEAQGNRVTLEVSGDRLLAKIEYEYIDYTEVEFRQVQPRDAIIEFLTDSAGQYVARSTQNTFTDIAVDQVFSAINLAREKPVKQNRISLEGYADPAVRTKFFQTLIKSIGNHNFVTVTEAFCYKPRIKASVNGDEKESELEDQPNVVRVTLKGTGVTKSFVIDELYEKGYYIVKVVWRVKPTSSMDADIFELEAQFGEPDSCTGFSYQARIALIFENGKITDKKRLPKNDEQDNIFRLIEAAAKIALATLE